eukprot:GHVQ01020460.1.p1 GENE.GHVQ01020460.1~~GHVQ01020460.1.p1  ORF type:complete len:205 (-),score=49.48 GHVQ01020460.1:627-1241(-)
MTRDVCVEKICLDTSSFVAACSEATHNIDHVVQSFDVSASPLSAQIHHEQLHRGLLLTTLQPVTSCLCGGEEVCVKEVYVSRRVREEVQTIFDHFGGDIESARGAKLLSVCKELPLFVSGISDESCKQQKGCKQWTESAEMLQALRETKRIRPRHKDLFSAAAAIGAVTYTADTGFVRACAHQGVDLLRSGMSVVHASRSLTGL